MTSSSTPQANARPACCGTRSPGGWRNAGWSSTSRRPALSTARTRRDEGLMSPSPSISLGIRSARGCRGASLADSSSTSSRRSQTTRASAYGGKSAAGDCTCVRTRPSQSWRGLQSDHPGLDQLLRALLPLGADQGPQADQRIPRALGHGEVQAAAPLSLQGAQVPSRRLPAPTWPVRPLAVWRAPRRLDDGSPVSREAHAGF